MKKYLQVFLCLWTIAVHSPFLFGQELEVKTLTFEPTDSARGREVPVKVYFIDSPKSKPVIIFSHGLGGSRNNNPYLGNHWAKHGYIVVFVQHHGSDESVWKNLPIREVRSAMKKAASAQSMIDRNKDIPFVLDQLETWNNNSEHPLHKRLDLERIGMTGHSFGAITTQAMMGQKFPGSKSAKEPRFDAFLPMSPSAHGSPNQKFHSEKLTPQFYV